MDHSIQMTTKTPWENDNTRETYSKHVIRHNGMIIATVGEERPISPAEALANARLFAAAPDLLEACKLALGLTAGEQCDDPETGNVQAALVKAIKKAEGKS